MRAIVAAPENWVEFRLEKGQFQYLDNRQFAHARTAFRNTQDASAHRHMLQQIGRAHVLTPVTSRTRIPSSALKKKNKKKKKQKQKKTKTKKKKTKIK